MNNNQEIKKTGFKKILLKDGKVFFSKETERKVFFFMTIIMLLMGVFVKLV
ncbi:MAG: hypothetical protein KAH62_00565 [Desulfobacula sp.]|nr:hypothetical protein [Desulfobacterales bacterium]MCK5695099.1 hypothetical protein [Desulfobacula sp.]